MTLPRVLSIQSHVVVGYAGNKSAVFPLQLLGYEVDVLNTVQFSNHTGYGNFGGTRFEAHHFQDIFRALQGNHLIRHDFLLTGYCPSAHVLQVVVEIVDTLRQVNPNLIYVLDPVCGDDGKLYVAADVVPMYKQLMQKATVITPNHFEAELFTGVTLSTLANVKAALTAFHQTYSLPNVLISSIPFRNSDLASLNLPEGMPSSCLVCAGSSFIDGKQKMFVIVFPKEQEHFEGVGDVFAALTLARFQQTEHASSVSPLAASTELVIASLRQIIERTEENAHRLASELGMAPAQLVPSAAESKEDRIKRLKCMELCLISSASAIQSPEIVYRAQELH